MGLNNDYQVFLKNYQYQQQSAYRANSNRNVKILSSIVLLERVDVKPNLKINTIHSLKQDYAKADDIVL